MLPLIEIAELPQLPASHMVLIDARGGADSRSRYLQGHLPGALFVDLEELAAHPADPAYGGRHPLPEPQVFAALLSRLGITPQTHVVVYDDKAGANSAARFWWMLKAIGHTAVQVLNGGLQAAVQAQLPLSQQEEQPVVQAESYPVPAGFAHAVTIEETGEATQNPSRLVIDVRETPRYLGQTEPLDLIAGHIPGAVNVFYGNNLNAEGRYLPAEELRRKYSEVMGKVQPAEMIVHCGSGVTACHTLLALEQAGLPGAKLYVGSWSEWSRRGLPIATDQL